MADLALAVERNDHRRALRSPEPGERGVEAIEDRRVGSVLRERHGQAQVAIAILQHRPFGNKDFQQLRILRAMTEALNWPVEIVGCPTVREKDGLAMSSRNQYLSADERERALGISRALMLAQGEVAAGEKRANRLVATMQNVLLDPGKLGRIPVSIDYVAAVDPTTLKPVDTITGPTVLAIAARVGATRLIDNMTVTPA